VTVNLLGLRINRGLSAADAAAAMGVSTRTLLDAESGKSVPRPKNALKIARFYGYKVTEVWPLEPTEGAAA
jgi:DNA-binding XRE family transcriptional regulator